MFIGTGNCRCTYDYYVMHDRGPPARVPGGGNIARRRCWRRDRSLPWLKRSRRKWPIERVTVCPDGGPHSCGSLHAARSLRRVPIANPFFTSAHRIVGILADALGARLQHARDWTGQGVLQPHAFKYH